MRLCSPSSFKPKRAKDNETQRLILSEEVEQPQPTLVQHLDATDEENTGNADSHIQLEDQPSDIHNTDQFPATDIEITHEAKRVDRVASNGITCLSPTHFARFFSTQSEHLPNLANMSSQNVTPNSSTTHKSNNSRGNISTNKSASLSKATGSHYSSSHLPSLPSLPVTLTAEFGKSPPKDQRRLPPLEPKLSARNIDREVDKSVQNNREEYESKAIPAIFRDFSLAGKNFADVDRPQTDGATTGGKDDLSHNTNINRDGNNSARGNLQPYKANTKATLKKTNSFASPERKPLSASKAIVSVAERAIAQSGEVIPKKKNSLTLSSSEDTTTEAPVQTRDNTLLTPAEKIEKRRARVNSVSLDARKLVPPYSPPTFLKLHKERLSLFEQKEITEYPELFFSGNRKLKVNPSLANYGLDDEKGDYKLVINDHIAYRYEIMGLLGKGAFGQVVKVLDHKTNKQLALKIIRNKQRYHQQALVEAKILEYMKEKDPNAQSHVIHIMDTFHFRNHFCLSFELLSINLYDFIKATHFRGFSLNLVRRFAIQMLICLRFLAKHKIIHCDLKPENVLLREPTKSAIAVIDFGSSCFDHEKVYTYIQSRFYRAPEVILGISYTPAIDIWSFACILGELATGFPMFPGENELDQLCCIMEVFGVPDEPLLAQSSRRKYFFTPNGKPRIVENSKGVKRIPASKTLSQLLNNCEDELFLDFLKKCFVWNPKDRLTAQAGMKHPWILQETQYLQQEMQNLDEFSETIQEITSTNSNNNNEVLPEEEEEDMLYITPPKPLNSAPETHKETNLDAAMEALVAATSSTAVTRKGKLESKTSLPSIQPQVPPKMPTSSEIAQLVELVDADEQEQEFLPVLTKQPPRNIEHIKLPELPAIPTHHNHALPPPPSIITKKPNGSS